MLSAQVLNRRRMPSKLQIQFDDMLTELRLNLRVRASVVQTEARRSICSTCQAGPNSAIFFECRNDCLVGEITIRFYDLFF